eukprot:scaffold1392_cov269-Chaetoceros_neogracile.AAC.18
MSSSTSSVRTSRRQADRRAQEDLVDQVPPSANTLDELAAQQHSPPPNAIPSDDSASVKNSKDSIDVSESELNDVSDGSETPAKARSSQNKKEPWNNYSKKVLFEKWQGGKVVLNNVTNELKNVTNELKKVEKRSSMKELELTKKEKKLATVAMQLANKDLQCEKQFLLNKTNKTINANTDITHKIQLREKQIEITRLNDIIAAHKAGDIDTKAKSVKYDKMIMGQMERNSKESGRQDIARKKVEEQGAKKREKEIEAQSKKLKTKDVMKRSKAALRWEPGENNDEAHEASAMKETVSNFRDRGVRKWKGDNIDSASDESNYHNRRRHSRNGRKHSRSSSRHSNSRRRDRRRSSHSGRSRSKPRPSNKRMVQYSSSRSSSQQKKRHSSPGYSSHSRRRSRSRPTSSNRHSSEYDHSPCRSLASRDGKSDSFAGNNPSDANDLGTATGSSGNAKLSPLSQNSKAVSEPEDESKN